MKYASTIIGIVYITKRDPIVSNESRNIPVNPNIYPANLSFLPLIAILLLTNASDISQPLHIKYGTKNIWDVKNAKSPANITETVIATK